MNHNDRIGALADSIREQVLGEATKIAEAAIYSAVNRDLAQADDAGLMFATASDDRLGSIVIVFNDIDGELAGPDGWQSGPKECPHRDPELTLDPLWVANGLRAEAEEEGYDLQPKRRERMEALECNLRAAADVLRRTLERADIEAQCVAAQSGMPAPSITMAAVETDKVGTERLQLDVHLPLTIILPRERQDGITIEEAAEKAARRCSGSVDRLRIDMSMSITDLLERKP